MKLKYSYLFSCAILLAGCAAFSNKTDTDIKTTPTAAIAQAEKKEPPARPLEPETLFDLLVAEIAAKERRFDITLGNYLRQSHATKDIGVVARTTQIARYLRAHQATMESVHLWLQLEPHSPEALQIAAAEYLHENEFDKSIEYIDRLLKQDANANFEYVLQQSERVPNTKRKDLIAALSRLSEKHPKNANVWFTKALAQEMNGEFNAAIDSSSVAIDINENFLPAILFKAELLAKTQQPEAATDILKKAVNRFESNKRLRLIYADSLLKANQERKALSHLNWLKEKYPDDFETQLASALILWDNGQKEPAKEYLISLSNQKDYADEAHSNLAEIYKTEGNIEKAISHFKQVMMGPFYPIAQTQLALLYAENNQYDLALAAIKQAKKEYPQGLTQFYATEAEVMVRSGKAEQALLLLEQALQQYPSHPQLLYAHAMVAERLNRIDILEKDLRQILKQNPENALALNALGYTLAERTTRLEEALTLIQKASSIEPNDPAVMDSLGWVYYKMGNTEKSLFYLKKAHEMLHDHEIAAHYGEVLWVTNQKEQAKIVWQEALKRFPKNNTLLKTMQKFLKEAPAR